MISYYNKIKLSIAHIMKFFGSKYLWEKIDFQNIKYRIMKFYLILNLLIKIY